MREDRTHEGMPLTLWSDTPEDFLLTPVEMRLLHATLEEQIARDPSIKLQIASAQVISRQFSNCGFFVNLEVPSHIQDAAPGILSSGTGHATLGFHGQTRYPLMSFTFSKSNRLTMLESVACDGEPWTPEECLTLLRAPLSMVWINTTNEKNWAAMEIE